MKTSKLKPALALLILLLSFYSRSQTITTVAGTGTGAYSGDGMQATASDLNYPASVTFDGAGNLYIADMNNNRVRKVNASGVISTFAGTGSMGYSGDGGPATSAKLNKPEWLYFHNPTNSLYISERGNSVIRKIDNTGTISTFAGIGVAGFSGMGGPATSAKFASPGGLVIGSDKKLYFAEAATQRILVVDTLGIINIFAGGGNATNDGAPALSAYIYAPLGMVFDAADNLYICCALNYRVKKIDTGSLIYTAAGTGANAVSGDGGLATSAQIGSPTGIARDGAGNIFFADGANGLIRTFSPGGNINAFAGGGGGIGIGDNGPANIAILNLPRGMAFDASGNLYFADMGHHRVRRIGGAGAPVSLKKEVPGTLSIEAFPNPVSDFLSFRTSKLLGQTIIEITDITGKQLSRNESYDLENYQLDLANLNPGMYFITISNFDTKSTLKIIKQ